MILNLITEFTNDAMLQLNSRYANALKINEITNDMQDVHIPVSQQAINYLLFCSDLINDEETESGLVYTLNARIEFVFNKSQKNNSYYKLIFDRYLFPLMRILNYRQLYERVNHDEGISQGLYIADVMRLAIVSGDNFENEYYRPAIEISLKVIDSDFSNINLKTDVV